MKKLKMTIVITLIFVFLGIMLYLLMFFENRNVEKISINVDNKETGNVYFEIEKIEQNKDEIIIQGWRGLHTNERRVFDTWVVLYDGNNYYKMPTGYMTRSDVTEKINDGNEYTHSGFICRIPRNKLKEEITYDIYLICRPDVNKQFEYIDYFVIDTEESLVIGR